jgi:peptidoglycan hydrolase CwlO-like protein
MIHHRTQHHVRFVHLFGILPILMLANASTLQVYARSVTDVQKDIQAKQKSKESAAESAEGLGTVATGIEGEINDLATQIASIQSQIDINTSRSDDLTNQIEAAQKRVEEQKGLLSANIRSMYIEGDISPLEMIASSKNLGDFVDK